MRLAAGVFSISLFLLLIGYVIGYGVCLWRYQPMRQLWGEAQSGTVVMPVVEVPDDWEPPSAAPPSVGDPGYG